MRACVQRVTEASVSVDGQVCGQIGVGLVVLLGVATGDEESDASWLADKIVGLRVFDDEQGKLNLALGEVGGTMLVVSQFTLLGDCRKGRRPSYTDAAAPELAESLYLAFVREVKRLGIKAETGRFRQHMSVALVNDGPVTLIVESSE